MLPKTFLITKCFVLLPEILSSVTITWGSVGCGGSSVLSRGGSVTWSAIPSQENSLQLKCQKKKSFTLIQWHRWIRHQRDQGRKEGEGGWPTGGDHLASWSWWWWWWWSWWWWWPSSLGKDIHRHHNHLQSRQAGGWRWCLSLRRTALQLREPALEPPHPCQAP